MAPATAINLALQDISELFEAPGFDPMYGKVQTLSGMDQLEAELRARPLADPHRLIITLPSSHISDGLEARTRLAVRRYAVAQIAAVNRTAASLRRRGRKALQFGLVFWAVCLLLATLFDAAMILPDFLRRFLSEGFIIVGWVALWHPAEMLFESWPLRYERRLYQTIHDMDVEVSA